jgi:hypothetical protein
MQRFVSIGTKSMVGWMVGWICFRLVYRSDSSVSCVYPFAVTQGSICCPCALEPLEQCSMYSIACAGRRCWSSPDSSGAQRFARVGALRLVVDHQPSQNAHIPTYQYNDHKVIEIPVQLLESKSATVSNLVHEQVRFFTRCNILTLVTPSNGCFCSRSSVFGCRKCRWLKSSMIYKELLDPIHVPRRSVFMKWVWMHTCICTRSLLICGKRQGSEHESRLCLQRSEPSKHRRSWRRPRDTIFCERPPCNMA